MPETVSVYSVPLPVRAGTSVPPTVDPANEKSEASSPRGTADIDTVKLTESP